MATRSFVSAEPEIDALKRTTGISEAQLNARIEEDKLFELSGHLGSFEQYVGVPGFDLNQADIADLKDCARDNGHQHAMTKAIKKWFNINRTDMTTYRSLIEILIKLRKMLVAEAVCKTVVGREASCTKTVSSEGSSGRVRSDGGVGVEIKNFKDRFMYLRNSALRQLQQSKVSVTDLQKALIIVPNPISSANEKFFTSNFLFEKAESIDGIFFHFSFYLSYINISLLEHIIEQFGSERLKEDMSQYAHDMTQFKARTTISDALKYLPKPKLSDQKNPPEGLSHLTGKFEADVNVATLEKLDEYGKNFARELSLSCLTFFLFEFQEGCLLITWLVPTSLESIISDKIQEKNVSNYFFFINNILELWLGRKQLFPFITKLSCLSPHLFQKYSEDIVSLEKTGFVNTVLMESGVIKHVPNAEKVNQFKKVNQFEFKKTGFLKSVNKRRPQLRSGDQVKPLSPPTGVDDELKKGKKSTKDCVLI